MGNDASFVLHAWECEKFEEIENISREIEICIIDMIKSMLKKFFSLDIISEVTCKTKKEIANIKRFILE